MLHGERIKARRVQFELSQAALGEKIGQEDTYISRLEHGHLQNITLKMLLGLCEELRCTPDYLLGYSDEPQRSTRRQRTPAQATAV